MKFTNILLEEAIKSSSRRPCLFDVVAPIIKQGRSVVGMKVRPMAWGNHPEEVQWLGEDMKGAYYILTNVRLKEYQGEPRHGKAWGILVHPGMKFAKTFPPTSKTDFVPGTEFTSTNGPVKHYTSRNHLTWIKKEIEEIPEGMVTRRIEGALQRRWELVE